MSIIHSVLLFSFNAFIPFDVMLLMFFPDVGPAIHTTRTGGAMGPGMYQGNNPLTPQAFVSMETENQKPDEEEKIVYL